jgi:hypothetical protein
LVRFENHTRQFIFLKSTEQEPTSKCPFAGPPAAPRTRKIPGGTTLAAVPTKLVEACVLADSVYVTRFVVVANAVVDVARYNVAAVEDPVVTFIVARRIVEVAEGDFIAQMVVEAVVVKFRLVEKIHTPSIHVGDVRVSELTTAPRPGISLIICFGEGVTTETTIVTTRATNADKMRVLVIFV